VEVQVAAGVQEHEALQDLVVEEQEEHNVQLELRQPQLLQTQEVEAVVEPMVVGREGMVVKEL
jgi:hypothetical protein